MYSGNKNEQVVLALLKKFKIRKIVTSPGTQNFGFANSVRNDEWFEVYSVVDERSAAYVANGLAFESGEPVVLSCTGATASRNYVSGLTEAYYRKLPIIALTGTHFNSDMKNFSPQWTDRTVIQNDIKLFSAELPPITDAISFNAVQRTINEALIIATEQKVGPVHLNIVSTGSDLCADELPDVQKVDYYNFTNLSKLDDSLLHNKKIGVLIGGHRIFTQAEIKALSEFAQQYQAAVFCDHVSNYSGANKLLISQVIGLGRLDVWPDILIDIGSVCGDYNAMKLRESSEIWRVSEDGVFHDRYEKMTKLFDMPEKLFFSELAARRSKVPKDSYYALAAKYTKNVSLIELPLSNTYIAAKVAELIPSGSYLHLGILNSLRNMDLFDLDGVTVSCNVGGFGIDGPVSTLVGQSLVNPDKLHFGVVGDLAFFYDMNVLGNRHIKNNIRLIVVNNGRGVEFRINPTIEDQIGEKLDDFTAAAGHNGSVKGWVESMGFKYLSAKNKRQLDKQINRIMSPNIFDFDKPVVLEVFTTVEGEKAGLENARNGEAD